MPDQPTTTRLTKNTNHTVDFRDRKGVVRCTVADLRAAVDALGEMPDHAPVTVLVQPTVFAIGGAPVWQAPTAIRADHTQRSDGTA